VVIGAFTGGPSPNCQKAKKDLRIGDSETECSLGTHETVLQ